MDRFAWAVLLVLVSMFFVAFAFAQTETFWQVALGFVALLCLAGAYDRVRKRSK